MRSVYNHPLPRCDNDLPAPGIRQGAGRSVDNPGTGMQDIPRKIGVMGFTRNRPPGGGLMTPAMAVLRRVFFASASRRMGMEEGKARDAAAPLP
ncbi:MAG TPA: hypothetical protein DD658_09890 [Deltaproteobacteria bacterium]|nr:hypothetical protein [Deltaproteobacteria bacterium]